MRLAEPSIANLSLVAAHSISILNFDPATLCDRPASLLAANNLSRCLRLCRRSFRLGAFLTFALRFFALRSRLLYLDLFASVAVTNFVTRRACNPHAAITVRFK